MFDVETLTHGSELTPLQLRSVFRQLGWEGTPPADTVLSPDQCLAVWVFMLINKLRFLAPEQKSLLYETVVEHFTGLGETIQSRAAQTPMLVIADSRYAACHNMTGWLDLFSGEILPTPKNPPLETIAYNLAVLFDRNQNDCARLKNNGA